MAYLTDKDYIVSVGRFTQTEPTTVFDPFIIAASARLKGWVGATTYSAALADLPTTDRYKELRLAETYLAIAEALPSVNRHDTGKGIELMGRTTGQMGTESTTAYINPEAMFKEQERLVNMASRLVEPYKTAITYAVPQYGEIPLDEEEWK